MLGDLAAADFECRPGGDAPTLGELSCAGRISPVLPAEWTPVPCSVTAFTVTPPVAPIGR